MALTLIHLLNKYGTAKFGDEWWPGNAEPWIHSDGKELAALLDRIGADAPTQTLVGQTVQLMGRYGEAKFGDEWWPGNAQPWIGDVDGARLEDMLEDPASWLTPLETADQPGV